MEEASGPTMPRIATVCRIQMLPWPTAIEVTCVRICSRADLPDKRRVEVPTPNPLASAWVIGRSRRAHPAETVAPSAAFVMAERRRCTAIMDTRASGPLGAAAPRVVEEGRAEAVVEDRAEVLAVEAADGAVAVAAAEVAVVVIGRSERKSWRN